MAHTQATEAARTGPGPASSATSWLDDDAHRAFLERDARRQLAFFRASLRPDGGFDVLDLDGRPLPGVPQELHTTTRLVHSFALGRAFGDGDADAVIDAGIDRLLHGHRDERHGGYAWTIQGREIADGTKLAYGHVFVLLAAASAMKAGHPDADRLLRDVWDVIDRHYWDESHGLLKDEFARDWSPFSSYRGMNGNMHGVEAMLAAFEATGERVFLDRADRILGFFVDRVAPAHGFRLPEHYREDWSVDPDYEGNPMFRPAGTTPGHSLELARLALQHWDLAGRPETDRPARARRLLEQALADAWTEDGGFHYTLASGGAPLRRDRYWWPVTEGIGTLAAFLKTDPRPDDESWYRRLWQFADAALIDHRRGGWYPELDRDGRPTARQFAGKPDIYHALQACLLPLVPGVSRLAEELAARAAPSSRQPTASAV